MNATTRTAAILILVVMLLPAVSAIQYHTTLLTVADNGELSEGGTADLFLDIRSGTGRIFIDSYPLSKLDTQFSTRYANEVACEFLDADCDKYDFFYTIRAGSSVVGGPSAGAAITVLTIGALENRQVAQDVAMTGTINSGGLIGPVAGILSKAAAAKEAGMTTVIISALTSLGVEEFRALQNASENVSINYSEEYDDRIIAELSDEDFRIVRAGDLYDALPYFIDKEYPENHDGFETDSSYTAVMEEVAATLCVKREELLAEAYPLIEGNETLLNKTRKAETQIMDAIDMGSHYSAASFCFSQNIDLHTLLLEDQGQEELKDLMRETRRDIERIRFAVDQEPLETIGDIETSAIVRERLVEAEEILDNLDQDESGRNVTARELAYAIERAYSGEVWSRFFALESEPYIIDKEHLKEACYNKLGEAEERVAYVESYLPLALTAAGRDELELAQQDRRRGEYALCLFKASKAKAEANILASVLAISEPRLATLVEEKLRAAERVLSAQAERSLFPIMGYSYYEYARSLEKEQPYSALTFAEYSLELSQLHLYFPEERSWFRSAVGRFPGEALLIFAIGFFSGVLVLFLLFRNDRKE